MRPDSSGTATGFDSDLPHCEEGKRVLAIPFDMTINDLPFHVRFGNPPFDYVGLFEKTLGTVAREGAGGLVDVTAHTHVFGRAPGAAAIDDILALAKGAGRHPGHDPVGNLRHLDHERHQ